MNRARSRLYKETIALAGIIQAATLVKELANNNRSTEKHFEASIASVFKVNSLCVEDVFGGQTNYVPGLSIGLNNLCRLIDEKFVPGEDLIRYSLEIIALQGRLQRNAKLASVISSRIGALEPQLAHCSITDPSIIDALSRIYEDTLSNMGRRIQVTGNRLYLENPYNVNKIRALLLAGVRAAMLWRQVGGKRWHIIFHRKNIRQNARELL